MKVFTQAFILPFQFLCQVLSSFFSTVTFIFLLSSSSSSAPWFFSCLILSTSFLLPPLIFCACCLTFCCSHHHTFFSKPLPPLTSSCRLLPSALSPSLSHLEKSPIPWVLGQFSASQSVWEESRERGWRKRKRERDRSGGPERKYSGGFETKEDTLTLTVEAKDKRMHSKLHPGSAALAIYNHLCKFKYVWNGAKRQ